MMARRRPPERRKSILRRQRDPRQCAACFAAELSLSHSQRFCSVCVDRVRAAAERNELRPLPAPPPKRSEGAHPPPQV